jgi:hypothetical protein
MMREPLHDLGPLMIERISMILRLCLLAIMLATATRVQAESFPTTFTVDSLDVAAKHITAWNGKMIALTGLVDSITTAYGKPYFHVILPKPNSLHKGLWIG